MWKDFNLKWDWRIENRKSHTCTFRRMTKWFTINAPINTRQRLISWPIDICQESLPILKSMNLLFGRSLDISFFVFLDHKYSLTYTLNRVACNLVQHAFCELKFLCFSQINSTSGDTSLPQFISLLRLMWGSPVAMGNFEMKQVYACEWTAVCVYWDSEN